jgi:uncharacterized protein (DUF302 family)
MKPEWDYYRRITVNLGLNRTVAKITRALREAGFVIGAAVDLRDLVKTRPIDRAVVLNVYDPAVAAAALQDDADLAVFVGYQVAVRELGSHHAIITVAEPLGIVTDSAEWRADYSALGVAAERAEQRLAEVLAAVEHSAPVAA